MVNGIDTAEWHPSVDPHLQSDGYCNYDITTLDKKRQCKEALQWVRRAGGPEPRRSRLVGGRLCLCLCLRPWGTHFFR